MKITAANLWGCYTKKTCPEYVGVGEWNMSPSYKPKKKLKCVRGVNSKDIKYIKMYVIEMCIGGGLKK